MPRIHHATAKRAASLQIELTIDGDVVVATKGGTELARGTDAKAVLAEAEVMLGGKARAKAVRKVIKTAKKKAKSKRRAKSSEDEDEDGEGDEEEGDEEESKSIIKRKYRERYRPFHYTNGDDLAHKITEAVSEEDEAGDMKVSKKLLRDFAKANGCWDTRYNDMNIGMARMNVGNRLRARVRKGYVVVWTF
jgi:hypothetical protein